MVARSFGSFCSLLLVWLCALGAAPVVHPTLAPATARSAVELALRDIAEAPQLASRAVSVHVTTSRIVERSAPNRLAPLAALAEPFARTVSSAARTALRRQATMHDDRPRWRAYDAAAPPTPSRSAH